jgi:hypothetical protein
VRALSVTVRLSETDLQIIRHQKTLEVRLDFDPDLLATTRLSVGGFARMSSKATLRATGRCLLGSSSGLEVPYTAL